MNRFALTMGVLVLLAADSATASCRGRMVHRRHYRAACPSPSAYDQRPSFMPATASYQASATAPPMAYASQQPASPGPAVAVPPMALPASTGGVQPLYNYAANPDQQAYYYTYDESGKLIVVQWVDWLFRGGRAEGMPRPPLPVIGALRNLNR